MINKVNEKTVCVKSIIKSSIGLLLDNRKGSVRKSSLVNYTVHKK